MRKNFSAIGLLVVMLASSKMVGADQLGCEGLSCLYVLPGAFAHAGTQSLRKSLSPPPPIVLALRAVEEGDHKELANLLHDFPELTKLRITQLDSTSPNCACKGERIEDLYVIHVGDPHDENWIQEAIARGDLKELERALKREPKLTYRIDSAYALFDS